MSDRGMKKWNAYKSLPEHEPALKKCLQEKFKEPRPDITSDEAELINQILCSYAGETLIIKYYRDREVNEITTKLSKIDPVDKVLILPDRKRIRFSELIKLKYFEDKKTVF